YIKGGEKFPHEGGRRKLEFAPFILSTTKFFLKLV
ncbi:MAG: hypothetical protein XU11_C0067G0006, partial [Candidatus Dadabacteria bacterium CSP1-2]